ncbi:hypothetical protein EVAR_23716_1 [Eumeta japonica]|uniref:Uncharacterized protein n=1 Tax=Eumeta variegata TaxID=151549 RepID=A0A4C1VEX5_EUMVA|nr:hypothetical protein EVAR_23716_1 [Eumeta japonica]
MLKDEFKKSRPKSVVVPQNVDVVPELIVQARHVIHREVKASRGISQKIELTSGPPYSPDTAPNNFYLFPSVKNKIHSQRFSSRESAVDAFKMHVLEIPQSD